MGKAFKIVETRYYLITVTYIEYEREYDVRYTQKTTEPPSIRNILADELGFWEEDDDTRERLDKLVAEYETWGRVEFGDRFINYVGIQEVPQTDYSVLSKYL